jgi:hypothetical protein
MDTLRDIDIDIDQLAVPATQVFAFIGLLWLSLKIFSFWRLIASLFILPGTRWRTTRARQSGRRQRGRCLLADGCVVRTHASRETEDVVGLVGVRVSGTLD